MSFNCRKSKKRKIVRNNVSKENYLKLSIFIFNFRIFIKSNEKFQSIKKRANKKKNYMFNPLSESLVRLIVWHV